MIWAAGRRKARRDRLRRQTDTFLWLMGMSVPWLSTLIMVIVSRVYMFVKDRTLYYLRPGYLHQLPFNEAVQAVFRCDGSH